MVQRLGEVKAQALEQVGLDGHCGARATGGGRRRALAHCRRLHASPAPALTHHLPLQLLISHGLRQLLVVHLRLLLSLLRARAQAQRAAQRPPPSQAAGALPQAARPGPSSRQRALGDASPPPPRAAAPSPPTSWAAATAAAGGRKGFAAGGAGGASQRADQWSPIARALPAVGAAAPGWRSATVVGVRRRPRSICAGPRPLRARTWPLARHGRARIHRGMRRVSRQPIRAHRRSDAWGNIGVRECGGEAQAGGQATGKQKYKRGATLAHTKRAARERVGRGRGGTESGWWQRVRKECGGGGP